MRHRCRETVRPEESLAESLRLLQVRYDHVFIAFYSATVDYPL